MKKIIHLSDLHFGTVNEGMLQALLTSIEEIKADIIIISGDLTQRATSKQFKQAKEFFAALSSPLLVIPGNHDIPLFNIWKRFLRPYRNYQRHISEDLNPKYLDVEVAIMGINSVRSSTIDSGRLNLTQLEAAREFFKPLGDSIVKIVVTHHPLNVLGHLGASPLRGARRALSVLQELNIDMCLSGHLHRASVGQGGEKYKITKAGPLFIQAGTALSSRLRNEANSFNLITIDGRSIAIEHVVFEKNRFIRQQKEAFKKPL